MSKNILFIHAEKKFKTGANYVNETIINNLELNGYTIGMLYPKESIDLLSHDLAGIANILFFHSLVKSQDHGTQYGLIQGTTYTTLAFLGGDVPVVSHYGSTTWGFLDAVPSNASLGDTHPQSLAVLAEMYTKQVIVENKNSLKPLEDISGIELYVAKKSDAVIATSQKVCDELISRWIPQQNIYLIHNAIEQYWFETPRKTDVKPTAELLYLGRLGNDDFTVKLKWLPELIMLFRANPDLNKVIIGMCSNTLAYEAYLSQIPKTQIQLSVCKSKIPEILVAHYGDLYINTSRYEGFCLSMVEAMSQGLIPIVFAFGVAPEIIRNGENGFVVRDLAEMQSRIDEIVHDAPRRKHMAEQAVQTAAQFHPSKIIGQYIKMYELVIRKDKITKEKNHAIEVTIRIQDKNDYKF